jgi:predicted RNA-binding Zn-ribbon protein involved in translation (DUF1610 family)
VPIEVICNQCGKSLKAPETMAGKRAKCPGCGNVLTVPEIEDEILDAEVIEPESLPPISAGLGGLLDDELAYRVADSQPTPAQATESRKPCPACGEMIVATAAVCRFCGEVFDEKLKKKVKKSRSSGGDDDSTLTTGEIVLGILCSGIGCIMGIIWVIQGKSKGWKLLGISLAASTIFGIIRAILEEVARN